MSRRKVGNSERDRWLANAKRDTVSGLLRGQSPDAGPRELKVTAARLSERRDAFLAAGEANLKNPTRDERGEAELGAGRGTHVE